MSHRSILRLALPAIVSNITVPLLGLVDTAIVGHLGSAIYLGAISIGATVFSVIYWIFGFLRAGTSGFTSQALGAKDVEGVKTTLQRSALFAVVTGLVILALQVPIAEAGFYFLNCTGDVGREARTYYYISIWGAPAVFLLYGFNGWFVGLQSTRTTMVIAIFQNVINIVLSLIFVFCLNMKVAGVALGTVLAQYSGLGLALLLWQKKFKIYTRLEWSRELLRNRTELLLFFRVNRDIMLRTLCLLAVTTFFTSMGARQGNLVLAANALLIQFFYLFSYFMDGFANAGEALAGRFYGARDGRNFKETVKRLFYWAGMLSIGCSLVYIVCGKYLLALLTDDASTLSLATTYLKWVALIPIVGFTAFIWDGIFIGITATKQLFLSMAFATVCFYLCFALTGRAFGNDGLWLSFCLFLLMRGIFQTAFYPALLKRIRLKE